MPLLEPETLSYGHYACHSLDETLPVFTDLLASKVVQRGDSAAVSAAAIRRAGQVRSICGLGIQDCQGLGNRTN